MSRTAPMLCDSDSCGNETAVGDRVCERGENEVSTESRDPEMVCRKVEGQ
jgi:hypothetical protein